MNKPRLFYYRFSIAGLGFLLVWTIGAFETHALSKTLIIAVSKYPVQTNWQHTSANNDAKLIKSTLSKRGVKEKDIYLLKDEKATYRSILSEFKNMERRLNPGDTLFLFFSGHGQQIVDDNGDEDDGWDEAFIPYDAHKRFKKGVYEGENHLRDDEIGYWLDRFRNKAGRKGAVWVIMDACHSGTANRDKSGSHVRGSTYLFHAPDKETLTPAKNIQSFRLKSRPGSASIGVFSACKPDQVNYEYNPYGFDYCGRLTYAFCKSIDQFVHLNSYSAIFLIVQKMMKEMESQETTPQTPYFESTEPL